MHRDQISTSPFHRAHACMHVRMYVCSVVIRMVGWMVRHHARRRATLCHAPGWAKCRGVRRGPERTWGLSTSCQPTIWRPDLRASCFRACTQHCIAWAHRGLNVLCFIGNVCLATSRSVSHVAGVRPSVPRQSSRGKEPILIWRS